MVPTIILSIAARDPDLLPVAEGTGNVGILQTRLNGNSNSQIRSNSRRSSAIHPCCCWSSVQAGKQRKFPWIAPHVQSNRGKVEPTVSVQRFTFETSASFL